MIGFMIPNVFSVNQMYDNLGERKLGDIDITLFQSNDTGDLKFEHRNCLNESCLIIFQATNSMHDSRDIGDFLITKESPSHGTLSSCGLPMGTYVIKATLDSSSNPYTKSWVVDIKQKCNLNYDQPSTSPECGPGTILKNGICVIAGTPESTPESNPQFDFWSSSTWGAIVAGMFIFVGISFAIIVLKWKKSTATAERERKSAVEEQKWENKGHATIKILYDMDRKKEMYEIEDGLQELEFKNTKKTSQLKEIKLNEIKLHADFSSEKRIAKTISGGNFDFWSNSPNGIFVDIHIKHDEELLIKKLAKAARSAYSFDDIFPSAHSITCFKTMGHPDSDIAQRAYQKCRDKIISELSKYGEVFSEN